MDTDTALAALAALAHPVRLEAFRTLVRHTPEGRTTGELAEALNLGQSTFSTHLAVLAKAGLVRSEKRGRHQVQHAEIGQLRSLLTFLALDCCQGNAELCAPLVSDLACC